ncbi:hypothetical protein SAHL_00275 [Salinisphaera orenii YIM 95161]|uniref:Uncharacterized protein n=1 Tax=Salinisphaera orenii YIM 95161 TaxID=1051139 RepID=A0A423QB31_9GAMM|nr:hypothetical protein SAHL_00275 [Salinisphaera halophila YIM 95161]
MHILCICAIEDPLFRIARFYLCLPIVTIAKAFMAQGVKPPLGFCNEFLHVAVFYGREIAKMKLRHDGEEHYLASVGIEKLQGCSKQSVEDGLVLEVYRNQYPFFHWVALFFGYSICSKDERYELMAG